MGCDAAQSPNRRAFSHYLRTGQRLPEEYFETGKALEAKFNPYHDPRNGQFTFAPGGPKSLSRVIVSHRVRTGESTRLPSSAKRLATASSEPVFNEGSAEVSDAVFRSDGPQPDRIDAQYRPNPRVRIGGNGGPPIEDPLILEQVFPGLQNAPGGSVLAIADNVFDVTGPAQRLTTQLHEAYTRRLIDQIRVANPEYQFQSLGMPSTMAGRINQIRELRIDRAVAFHTMKQEDRPLQVETLRFLQERVDIAYEDALRRAEEGTLKTRLSTNEAIGNYVDQHVRMQLKRFYDQHGVPTARGRSVQVNRRAYDTSADNPRFRGQRVSIV